MFAVANEMVGHDVVLPASVVTQLKDTPQLAAGRPCVSTECNAAVCTLAAAAVEVGDLG